MADKPREAAIENLAIASAIGFLAILLAAASALAGSASAAQERAAIASLSGGSVAAEAARLDDPAFSRIYALRGSAADFGAVLSLEGESEAFRAAFLFKRDGRPVSAKAVGRKAAPEWLSSLVVGAEPYPETASGEIGRYFAWSDALRRASLAVEALQENPR